MKQARLQRRESTWLGEGDTREIFVSKTVDESNSARVLVGCKPINLRLKCKLGVILRLFVALCVTVSRRISQLDQ